MFILVNSFVINCERVLKNLTYEKMYIEPGVFTVDSGMEEVFLNGNYDIKKISNEAAAAVKDMDSHIHCQIIYIEGNVFYRTDTENVEDLIKHFIKYTYDPCKELENEFDFSVQAIKQMRGGTICPTKKVLFAYKNKVFVAFGRYIFGYDKTYAKFKRELQTLQETEDHENETISSDEESELYDGDGGDLENWFNNRIKTSAITNNEVILAIPEMEYELNEYVYSFMIYDQVNGILDAFGLYR